MGELSITSSCREHTHHRGEFKCYPKGIFANSTKIGPALDVLVTKRYGRYRVEIKIDSLAKDGSQSWVCISSVVERHLTELSLDCTEPIGVDINTLGTEKPVAFIPWNVQHGASSSGQQKDVHIPIDQFRSPIWKKRQG